MTPPRPSTIEVPAAGANVPAFTADGWWGQVECYSALGAPVRVNLLDGADLVAFQTFDPTGAGGQLTSCRWNLWPGARLEAVPGGAVFRLTVVPTVVTTTEG